MSLRRIYGRVPAKQRICSYYRCQRPILRNIDMDEQGRLYHHGCLLSALEERYRCLNCYAVFNATQVSLDYQLGKLTLLCPHCGSSNLKRLKSWSQQ